MLEVKVNGVIVGRIAPFLLILEMKPPQFQLAMVVMKSAVTNSFSVEMLQENASPRGGNATTTKIVKMARTNMTVVSTHYSLISA
jgi:hypothetical protein